ncbi:DUF4381 domain-containing protein [Blastopirellula marina]|uniref:DUF4381 domain-containing protein n=1 Tax=Blastopirellula marina TaxID=124 RepID=A0A2S8G6Z1_9BACT|nr:DUF4381 domain-containing protein [Blastopirellula marina]PQO40222.1 DUF4381 domain-containing protein [Blastopirellula marina]PTL45589.1 DUF4381 domain-containing protein [Blastopirellula marina]
MNDDPTNLDRLHDIVMPPAVPWFPLASGWYVLIALVVAVTIWGLIAAWRSWQAGAYRRAALAQLEGTQTVAEIGEILRRTALVIAPRAAIAPLVGDAWADWLESRADRTMSADVRRQLVDGGYAPNANQADLGPLRSYAAGWIKSHRPSAVEQG